MKNIVEENVLNLGNQCKLLLADAQFLLKF